MKNNINKHAAIIAGIIAVIGFTGLIKGMIPFFIGCLFISSMIIGAMKAFNLLEQEEDKKDFNKSNLKNGILAGICFSLSFIFPGLIGLAASFVGGIFIGLIMINAMFDPKNKK